MQLTWAGRRVLVAEDNIVVAMPLVTHMEDYGATVIGPVPSLGAAFAALAHCGHIDGAVLDVELGNEMVWPFAAVLKERGVPFVFGTALVEDCLYPSEFLPHPRFFKPYAEDAIADALRTLIERRLWQKQQPCPVREMGQIG